MPIALGCQHLRSLREYVRQLERQCSQGTLFIGRPLESLCSRMRSSARVLGQGIACFPGWLKMSQHVNKTGFSRMRVGLAAAVVSIRTARVMQLTRLGLLKI